MFNVQFTVAGIVHVVRFHSLFPQLPINPSPVLSVFDFDPEEIARQLTLIDYALFSKIKPAELLNQAWQKARLRHRAQNILRLVERVNNLTLWVATTILSQKVLV